MFRRFRPSLRVHVCKLETMRRACGGWEAYVVALRRAWGARPVRAAADTSRRCTANGLSPRRAGRRHRGKQAAGRIAARCPPPGRGAARRSRSSESRTNSDGHAGQVGTENPSLAARTGIGRAP